MGTEGLGNAPSIAMPSTAHRSLVDMDDLEYPAERISLDCIPPCESRLHLYSGVRFENLLDRLKAA